MNQPNTNARPNFLRLRPAATAALGQSGFDVCKLIPIDGSLRTIVSKYGCLPAGKALLAAKIAEAATPTDVRTAAQIASGVASPSTPAWAQVLAYATPEIVADCLCRGQAGGPLRSGFYPTPVQPEWYENPVLVGGLLAAGVALAFFLSKKSTPATPTIVVAPTR